MCTSALCQKRMEDVGWWEERRQQAQGVCDHQATKRAKIVGGKQNKEGCFTVKERTRQAAKPKDRSRCALCGRSQARGNNAHRFHDRKTDALRQARQPESTQPECGWNS